MTTTMTTYTGSRARAAALLDVRRSPALYALRTAPYALRNAPKAQGYHRGIWSAG